MRLRALVCAAACLLAAPGPVSGAERSCADLRQFYTGKGFTLAAVPQTEISGEFGVPLRCELGSCCDLTLQDLFLIILTCQSLWRKTSGFIK